MTAFMWVAGVVAALIAVALFCAGIYCIGAAGPTPDATAETARYLTPGLFCMFFCMPYGLIAVACLSTAATHS